MVLERFAADSETTFAIIFGTSRFLARRMRYSRVCRSRGTLIWKTPCPRPFSPCWMTLRSAFSWLIFATPTVSFYPVVSPYLHRLSGRDDLELFFITLAAILVFLIFSVQSVAYRRFGIVLAHSVFGSSPCRGHAERLVCLRPFSLLHLRRSGLISALSRSHRVVCTSAMWRKSTRNSTTSHPQRQPACSIYRNTCRLSRKSAGFVSNQPSLNT